jgi:hypothetical protein
VVVHHTCTQRFVNILLDGSSHWRVLATGALPHLPQHHLRDIPPVHADDQLKQGTARMAHLKQALAVSETR